MRTNISDQNQNISVEMQMRIVGLTFFGFLFIFSVLAIVFLNPDVASIPSDNYQIFDLFKFIK